MHSTSMIERCCYRCNLTNGFKHTLKGKAEANARIKAAVATSRIWVAITLVLRPVTATVARMAVLTYFLHVATHIK